MISISDQTIQSSGNQFMQKQIQYQKPVQSQNKILSLKPPTYSNMLYNSTPSLSMSTMTIAPDAGSSPTSKISNNNPFTRRQLGLQKPVFSSRLPTHQQNSWISNESTTSYQVVSSDMNCYLTHTKLVFRKMNLVISFANILIQKTYKGSFTFPLSIF